MTKFLFKEVKLPVSKERPGNKLIGFDKSFCVNRESDYLPKIDVKSELSKLTNIFDDQGCFIESLNLRIDFRFGQFHNFTAYNNKDKFHQHCVNQLILQNNEPMLEQWVIQDPARRRKMCKNSNYLELFEVESVEDLRAQIRRAGEGLEYIYDDDQIRAELKTLTTNPGAFDKNTAHNKCVLTYQPHFYRRENALYQSDPEWRRRLIDNCKAFLYKKEHQLNDKEMLRQIKIAGLHQGFSHHSSFWIKAFIEKYQITSIGDPCSGWGQRLIGASGIKYISNDIDAETIAGQQKIRSLLGSDVTFYCQDASTFSPAEEYEAVFTCPPYFTTEIYFGDHTSTAKYPKLEDWVNQWWGQVIDHWWKPTTKYFAFVINNEYKEQLKKVCQNKHMKLLEEIPVGKPNNLNHFQRTAKNSFKGEWCIIFSR
jgi:hypothetical protein